MKQLLAFAGALFCIAGFILPSFAQQPLTSATQPAFEVASIKPSSVLSVPVGEGGGGAASVGGCNGLDGGEKGVPVGRCVAKNISLRFLMALAYGVPPRQMNEIISGGPGWLDSERYDIEAKSESPATQAQLYGMLQTLLADRIKLKVHRENKTIGVLVLTEAPGGHKMKPSDGDGPAEVRKGSGVLSAKMMSVAELAEQLERDLRTIIVDRTGLKGRYDIEMNITAYMMSSEEARGAGSSGKPDPLDIIQQVLLHQLGIKVEPRKESVEIVVIDHVEKPTLN